MWIYLNVCKHTKEARIWCTQRTFHHCSHQAVMPWSIQLLVSISSRFFECVGKIVFLNIYLICLYLLDHVNIVVLGKDSGGVGDMLCQLLRIYGLRVVGVVGSQSKVSSCKAGVQDTSEYQECQDQTTANWALPKMYHQYSVDDILTISSIVVTWDSMIESYWIHRNIWEVHDGVDIKFQFGQADVVIDKSSEDWVP